MSVKNKEWFDCIMVVPPKLFTVIPPQEEDDPPMGFEFGKNTEFVLRELLFDDEILGVDYNTDDMLEQAFEYWLTKHSEVIKKYKDNGSLDTPASVELAKEILYYERSLKLTTEKKVG